MKSEKVKVGKKNVTRITRQKSERELQEDNAKRLEAIEQKMKANNL